MKIFIIGLPQSGRSTIAQAIADQLAACRLDAMSWIKDSFRDKKHGEHTHHYEDEYHHFLSIRRATNPSFVIQHIEELMTTSYPVDRFVIDGITSPKDFTELFDYRQDVVVFLNRTDAEVEIKDHENIGVSVIRDYCFWLSSAGLLKKNHWLEYNFKIPGDNPDFIKEMGSKNRVFIAKSIIKVMSHLQEELQKLVGECK